MPHARPYVQMGLLGEAIDHAPAAVLVADENGDYVAVNQFACETFGYERDEFVRLNVSDVVEERSPAKHYERFVRSRREEGTVQGRRKDGTTFRFRYRAGETRIGELTYYVSVGWPE